MSLINLHAFISRSCANGPGERSVVWVQGCTRRCVGCFNPDAQVSAIGELITISHLLNRILVTKGIDGVTFSGGEPFAQARQLAELARELQKHELTVVCYTGYTLEQLQDENREDWEALLSSVDLLIDGPFIQSKQCHRPYRGSANQRLHFLSGKIQHEEIDRDQITEFMINTRGEISQTGFPEFTDVFAITKEVAKIINYGGKHE